MTYKITVDEVVRFLEAHVSIEVNELADTLRDLQQQFHELEIENRELHDELAKMHVLYHEKHER